MALRHDIANAPTWAMFVAPHVGGIFSFYRGLRRALRDRVRSVELDGDESRWREYDPTLAGPEHTILLLDGCDAQAAGRRVAQWLDEAGIQVVLVTAMTPAIVHDAIPHLPRNIRVIARLTEISQHSYQSALRHAQALDGVIVQCTRQAKDIAAIAPDLPQHRLSNAVDTDRFNSDAQGIAPEAPLRLLFLDRLVDLQKRVFLLPEICRALDATDIAYTLTVAGDGPDAAQLRQRLARWITDGRVTMPGAIAGADVPDVMRAHDIYLTLSRNEGSPNAVLEALASGLVTIAFDIPGVIDDVLRDGRSGYIVPSGDTRAVVDRIGRLDADPQHVYSKPRRHPVVPYGTNRHESADEVFEVPVLTSTRGALRVWPTGSLDSARGHWGYPWLRRPARTFAVAARARPAGDLRRRLH